MKVRDQVDMLQHLPQGAKVLAASDAEGNSFNEIIDFDMAYVRKSDMLLGRVEELLYDEDLDELTPEEIREDLEEVVVLWPV